MATVTARTWAGLGEATDFTAWAAEERRYLRSDEAEEDAEWWRGALNHGSARRSVLSGLERGTSHETRRTLPDDLAAQVRRAHQKDRVTSYSLLLTATLRGDRDQNDLVVTTSFGHRLTMDDYATVGCLTSRTLIPVHLDGAESLDTTLTVQRRLWDALERSRLPYAWIRKAAWPDSHPLLDADPEVPYFALNESWQDRLVLDGLDVRGVARKGTRSADTLELWVEQSLNGYELIMRGPYAEGTLRALQDEVVERLGTALRRPPPCHTP
ncbi:condensation domain-containing protein [Streptomyces sp. NPDC020379]|uniref:condensation domain-containing protein n=1 Tax=Streptomyces sp. NPDC020379 TaxID=3365071 RepID=UPI0037A33F17